MKTEENNEKTFWTKFSGFFRKNAGLTGFAIGLITLFVSFLFQFNAGFSDIVERIDTKFIDIDERIDNRFSDIDERIDTRFIDIDERIDTRFIDIDERIDTRFIDIDERIDNRFSDIDERIDNRFSGLDKRIDTRFTDIDERIDRRLSEVSGKVGENSDALIRLEKDIGHLKENFSELKSSRIGINSNPANVSGNLAYSSVQGIQNQE